MKKLKVSDLIENPDNPRVIRNEKFEKLIQSIRDFPEMLEARPIVIDENKMVIGGNMRLKACKELKMKTVHTVTLAGLTDAQKKEFLIKDNSNYGEWDWGKLANEWDSSDLTDWGLDVWNPKLDEGDDFEPKMDPTVSNGKVSEEDIAKAEAPKAGAESRFLDCMCPECGHEFKMEIK